MGGISSKRRALGWCLAGLLLSVVVPPVAEADETEPVAEKGNEQHRLERVQREIEKLQSSLAAGTTEESTLLGELQRLDLQLALHRRQLLFLRSELEQCQRQILEASLQARGMQADLLVTRRVLTARLRALYVSGPPTFERLLLTAQRPREVMEGYRYASLAAQSDGQRADSYRSGLSQLRTTIQQLEAHRSDLASLKTQEVSRRRELETARSDRSRLLNGVQKGLGDQQKALSEMQGTEKALQRLVEALSTGEAVPPEWRIGFERFRGLLPWPVSGKVLVPFGARKNSRFDTRVPHPGVDLAVTVGQPVRAVFEGRVAFSDWFKGYGNLIILDHGEGFLTIYAHASERLVAAGDRIAAEQVIAKGGDTGSLEGPRLYFEIWRNGKPEDPLAWLARH